MKRFTLLTAYFLLSFFIATAQTQLENTSFEEWEPEDENSPFFEPIEWSSIKTGDHPAASASPVVVYRSDDAHTGNYSAYLINKYTGIIDQVVTGTMTNGRIHIDKDLIPAKSNSFTDIHNSQWNTPLTKKPDSLVGWYKANPVTGDFPTVKAILHADSNSIPGDSLKWIARAYWTGENGVAVNQWKRFSMPFDYYMTDTPEFILVILTAGNGLHAIEDSEAWYDDVELIYNGSSIDELSKAVVNIEYANGQLQVRFSSNKLIEANLAVVDLNGRIIYEDKINTLDMQYFNLRLTTGIYIVQITSENKSLSKKIFIE